MDSNGQHSAQGEFVLLLLLLLWLWLLLLLWLWLLLLLWWRWWWWWWWWWWWRWLSSSSSSLFFRVVLASPIYDRTLTLYEHHCNFVGRLWCHFCTLCLYNCFSSCLVLASGLSEGLQETQSYGLDLSPAVPSSDQTEYKMFI